jgi:LuxR family maltose regulon positive regulatory protein
MHAVSDPLIHTSTQIFLEAWRGRIRDVIADTAEAEESLASSQVRQRAAFVRIAITRALIEIELGDPMQAVEHLHRAADELAGRVIPHTTHDVPLQHAVLRALRLSGRADLTLERGLAQERAIDRSRAQVRCSITEEVVRAACAVDDLAIAESRLDALRGPCARPLATAWIALARGDLRGARQAVACLDLPDLLVRAPRRALDVLEVRHRAALPGREQDDLREAAALLADEHGLSRSYCAAFGGTADVVPGRSDAGVQPLSERELDVLRGLASGASSRDLAASLSVSPNTLKTHLRAVYRKLGAVDRADAVWRARAAGLVPSAETSSPR